MSKQIIKARGYSEGEWVYGSAITYKNGDVYIVEHIDEELSFEVEPESVSLFTGKLDITGKEIYAKDLVKNVNQDGSCYEEITDVVWSNQDCAYELLFEGLGRWKALGTFSALLVVGNLWEENN